MLREVAQNPTIHRPSILGIRHRIESKGPISLRVTSRFVRSPGMAGERECSQRCDARRITDLGTCGQHADKAG